MSNNYRPPKMQPPDRDAWEDYAPHRRSAKKKADSMTALIIVISLLAVTSIALALYIIFSGTSGEPPESAGLPATLPPTELLTAPPTELPTAAPTLPPTQPPTVPPTLPPTEPPTAPAVSPTAAPAGIAERIVQERQCYVISGIGALKIRSGPGTDYPEVGRLDEGTPVTVMETAQSGSEQWGRITRGWVNMNYIADSAPSAATAGIQVRVKLSAGELRVRSGPGTNYDSISRLQAGQIVTVTETQTEGGMQWGHISQGWISMDYVETVSSTTASSAGGGDRFLGQWSDELGMRCSLLICSAGTDSYTVEFNWSSGADNTTFWRAYGTYDQETDSIYYGGCRSWTVVYGDDGSYRETTHYTEGTGSLYFSGGGLYWQDDQDNQGARCRFTKIT